MSRTDTEDTPLDLTAERLKWLEQTRSAILSAESPYLIAHAALKYIRERIPVQRATVAEFDLENAHATVLAADSDAGTNIRTGLLVPVESFGVPPELQSGDIRHVKDLMRVFRPTSVDREMFLEGIRSYINVPLLAQERLIGALNLASSEANRFSNENIDVARDVADMLAVAILQDRYQAKDRYLQAFPRQLRQAHGQFVRADSMSRLLDDLLDALRDMVPFSRACVYLRDDKNEFALAVQRSRLGLNEQLDSRLPETLSMTDLAQHPLLEQVLVQQKPFRESLSEPDATIQSQLGFPLGVGSRLLGLVTLESEKTFAFDKAHQELGQLLVFQAALAIENQRLMAENEAQNLALIQTIIQGVAAEKKQRDLTETLLDVMATLSSSLDLD